MGVGEFILGLLEEQPVALITELFLQPPLSIFKIVRAHDTYLAGKIP